MCQLTETRRKLTPLRNSFMKEWFPKEVKVKQKENDEEVVKEHATEVGMRSDCVVM